MIRIIQPDPEDLAGPFDRRPQVHFVEREPAGRRTFGRFDRGPELFEPGDQIHHPGRHIRAALGERQDAVVLHQSNLVGSIVIE